MSYQQGAYKRKFKLTHIVYLIDSSISTSMDKFVLKYTPITTKNIIKQGVFLLTLHNYLNPHRVFSSAVVLAVVAALASRICHAR
jgi:hypothetical protein